MSSPLSTDALAERLWNYHRLNQTPTHADIILVLGSHDLRVADFAAKLLIEGWAPLLVCSGGIAHDTDLLATGWSEPESVVFAKTAITAGVPSDKILIENRSQNTGQNFAFTHALLKEKEVVGESALVITKPYMERRAYATGAKQWPELKMTFPSLPLSYEEYCSGSISKETIISIMVGDLQRIIRYPELGFQIPQKVPQDVREAYDELVARGYDKHLMQ